MYKILHIPTGTYLKTNTSQQTQTWQVLGVNAYLEEEIKIADYTDLFIFSLNDIVLNSYTDATLLINSYIASISTRVQRISGDLFTNKNYFEIIEV